MSNPCIGCSLQCEDPAIYCGERVAWGQGIAIEPRELSYENGRQDAIAEQQEAAEAAREEPETFDEIFPKFDAWYWEKYRHHPEKMVVEQFYKFLNTEAV